MKHLTIILGFCMLTTMGFSQNAQGFPVFWGQPGTIFIDFEAQNQFLTDIHFLQTHINASWRKWNLRLKETILTRPSTLFSTSNLMIHRALHPSLWLGVGASFHSLKFPEQSNNIWNSSIHLRLKQSKYVIHADLFQLYNDQNERHPSISKIHFETSSQIQIANNYSILGRLSFIPGITPDILIGCKYLSHGPWSVQVALEGFPLQYYFGFNYIFSKKNEIGIGSRYQINLGPSPSVRLHWETNSLDNTP